MTKKIDLRKFDATLQHAATTLGKGFSCKTINRRIESGVWVQGIHWVNVGAGLRRQIRLNLEAIVDPSTWRKS